MTPREELLRDFDALVDKYHASRQETRAMLNQYAIGRWVPVSERLPEFNKHEEWEGCMRWHYDNECVFGQFCAQHFKNGLYTHWLDLQMPEVETD